MICPNGAAAHLVHPGDLVIIVSYEGVPNERLAEHRPQIVHVDGDNRIVDLAHSDAELTQSIAAREEGPR
jgi:aspartate 1-decarboxylase